MREGQANTFQFSRQELADVFATYITYDGYNTVGSIPAHKVQENPELISLVREAVVEHAGGVTDEGPSNDGSYTIVSAGWWHW